MGVFDSIPIRSNADTGLVDASWWNTIRSALINAFGVGVVAETQFTIADNQASYANVTGLLFDEAALRSVRVDYSIYRTDGVIERREIGALFLTYKPVAASWTLARRTDTEDDALNISDAFSITSGGQVQYKSDSMGGTYLGKMRFKVAISFAKET